MKSAFLEPADWLLANSDHNGDQVHWTRTVDNYARALDLYLALENAYDFYGGADQTEYDDPNSTVLLSTTQKKAVMSKLFESMEAINGYLYSDALDPFSGVQNYEAEPGNRPLKMFLAMGYGALTLQNYDPSTQDILNTANDYLQKAFRSGGLQETKNSIKYWSYQTHNGKHFWAEGSYYFELSLLEVLPFWHSIRLNNMLNWNGNNISDPFKNSWFLSPLDWLANLTTPNGDLPPIDDSNKRTIRYSNLMSWNATYSNNTLGKQVGDKFAWIHNRILDNPNVQFSDVHTLLVDIAIPKSTTPQPPKNLSGNDNANQTGNLAKQQLIARWSDLQGARHYLLLNGESGDAIPRGEGHEQADQLQLLYYYAPNASTEESLLMDTGYDHASATHNSSWNVYRLQNIMSIDNATNGGLPAPYVEPAVYHKVSKHASVNYLYKNTYGSLDVLKGQVNIKHYNTAGQFIYTTKNSRNIIVVRKDPDHSVDSYFVDIASNDDRPLSISSYEAHRHDVHMRYYSDTQSYTHHPLGWSKFDHGSKDLYLFSKPVEWKLLQDYDTYYSTDYLAREVQGRDIGDPADQKGYYVSYRGLGGASNSASKSWNIVTIFDLADSQPQYTPNELISYADDNYARTIQAWEYQHSSNVVDVIVKRAKSKDNTDYNGDITFNVPAANGLPFMLPAGKDYGFVRLDKINGVWQIDPNYQINLTRDPNAFVYYNSSVGTKTYPSNAHIYVADNSTLTITGDVTMQSGTTVHLGAGASINVNSGGRIDATGTTFQTISGSTASADRWSYIKLLSNGNTFSSCTFEGAEKGLYVASSGNMINGGYFTANAVGLYLNSGDATLKGTIVEQDPTRDGTDDGAVVRGTATLYLTANESGIFLPARFRDLDRGIDISDFGQVVAYETAFRRNDYNIHITGDGEFDGSGAIVGQGYNSINRDPNTIYDVYNLSSNYATAQFNWWGSSTEPPGDWRFYGNVTRMNPVSCDPTISGRHCDPISSGGGSCDPLFPCSASANLNSQGTLDTKSKVSGPVDSGLPSFDIPKIKDIIQAIYTYINKHPNDPAIPQYIRRVHTLLQLYDKDGSIRKWAGFDDKLDSWLSLFLFDRSTAAKQATITDRRGDSSIQLGRPDVGQTVMMIHLDDALRQHNYAKVLKLAKKYKSAIVNNRFRASLIAAKAVAWEQTRQFGKALAAYEQIENLNFKSEGEDGFQHPEYPIIKKELADSMVAHGQTKSMLAKTKDTVAKTKEETPNQIKVASPYPNPFNPTTTIPFSVPSKMHVAIKVYNMLGRRVATLTDKSYKTGRYEVRFNGDNVASGVYFIRSSIGNKSFVNEITLIK